MASAGPELLELFASNSYFARGNLPWSNHSALSTNSGSIIESHEDALSLSKMNVWAFWNLSHQDFKAFNSELIARLNSNLEGLDAEDSIFYERYLPSFVTNFGHLSLLFFYINRYRKNSTRRSIKLPMRKMPNPFLYELIKRESPLTIEEIKYEPEGHDSIRNIDYLTYSLGSDNLFESGTSASFAPLRIYDEYLVDTGFQLSLTEEEILRGRNIFAKEIGHRDFSFIVALHIRQTGRGNQLWSQTRDCNIETLRAFCGNIAKNGGIVVRMGSPEFPSLDLGFPAFDYAHSRIRSDFMDCWLWSEAKFWVGNANGAYLAAMAFGKPRIIVNQYYLDLVGPSRDMAVPKKIYSGNYQLSLQEIFETRISRCMNPQEFNSLGLRIEDLSQNELLELSKLAIQKYVNEENLQIEEQFDQSEKKHLFMQPSNLLMTTPKLS